MSVVYEYIQYEPNLSFFQSLVCPFNLRGGELARFYVFSTPAYVYLHFDVHHILFDGISANVFLNDIASAYRGELLSEEGAGALDYSLHYTEWKKTQAYDLAEKYFDGLLNGVESYMYPPISSGSLPSGDAASCQVYLPLNAVRNRCRMLGVTENAFFLSAVTEVLRRAGYQDTVQICIVSNGRSSGTIIS